MQSSFQVGFSLADLFSDPATGKAGDPASLAKIAGNLKTRPDGQPFALGGFMSGHDFEAVFETMNLSSVVPSRQLAQENALDTAVGEAVTPTDPENYIFTEEVFLKAIETGDINIDDVLPPGSPLNDHVKAVLAARSEAMALNPVKATQIKGFDTTTPADIIEGLQKVAAALPPRSPAQVAVLAVQAQVQAATPNPQQMTAEPSPLSPAQGPTVPPTSQPSAPLKSDVQTALIPLAQNGGQGFVTSRSVSSEIGQSQARSLGLMGGAQLDPRTPPPPVSSTVPTLRAEADANALTPRLSPLSQNTALPPDPRMGSRGVGGQADIQNPMGPRLSTLPTHGLVDAPPVVPGQGAEPITQTTPAIVPRAAVDPLTQSLKPSGPDQNALALSAQVHASDQTPKSDRIKPALEQAGPLPTGQDGTPTRPAGAAPLPAGVFTASSAPASPFDVTQIQQTASEVIPSDPNVEAAAREARTSSAIAPATTVPTAPATQAQPQQVARQIAVAIQSRTSGAFEITLNPAELGSVRISLTSADTGMIVNIQAERPETLDLIRRNTDMLADDFRDLGFESTSFSFEGSDGEQRSPDQSVEMTDHGASDLPDVSASNETSAPPAPAPIMTDGAVDIRM